MPSIYTQRGDTGITDTLGGGRIRKTDRLIAAIGAIDSLNSSIGIAYETIHANHKYKVKYLKAVRAIYFATISVVCFGVIIGIRDPYLLPKFLFAVCVLCFVSLQIRNLTFDIKRSDTKRILDQLNVIMNLNFTLSSVIAELPSKRRTIVFPDVVQRVERWIDDVDNGLPALSNFILPRGDVCTATVHRCRTDTRTAERVICEIANDRKFIVSDRITEYINRLSDYFFNLSRHLLHVNNKRDVLVEFVYIDGE